MFACIRRKPSARHPRRGDTAKVVLISLLAVFGVMLIVCAGLGFAFFLWFQKNFGQAIVSDPAAIRTMTSEIADITIPAEFTPYSGSKLFGMTTLTYQWCPEGNCPTLTLDDDLDEEWDEDSDLGMLTLTSFVTESALAEVSDDAEFFDEQFDDEYLAEQYVSFTKEVKEFEIKGRSCKFYVIRGQERIWDEDFDEEMTVEEMAPESQPDEPEAADAGPADAAAAVAAVGTNETAAEQPAEDAAEAGRSVVWIEGIFPGKTGDVTLSLYLAPEMYDDALIQKMLASIR